MREAVSCTRCGAKVRASHGRCPRCRAYLGGPDPVASETSSRKLQQVAAGLGGTFVVVLAGLWLFSDSEPVIDVSGASARISAPAAQTPEAAPPAAGRAADPQAFFDESAAGAAAYDAGDYPAALAQFQAAVERNPQDAEALSNLGQVLVRLDRAAEAIPYFERAVALIPNRWAYRFNLARAHGQTGRWDLAVPAYQQAQALFPDDYATAFNLGQALHKLGNEAAAVEAYQRAISLEPNDPTFRMALGISYERLQQPAQAAAAYREALRLAPDSPDAERVTARIGQLTPQGPAVAPPAPPAPPAGSGGGGR